MNLNKIKRIISRELNKTDPIGLISMGAPKEEYNPEVEEIVKKIGMVKREKEVEELIYRTFVKMFGLKIAVSRERYSEVAKNIFRRIKRTN